MHHRLAPQWVASDAIENLPPVTGAEAARQDLAALPLALGSNVGDEKYDNGTRESSGLSQAHG